MNIHLNKFSFLSFCFLALFVVFTTYAQEQTILDPYPVEEPDLPDKGWLWAGSSGGVGGWGLNVEIQDGFGFGAIYTYDVNGNPIWYTFGDTYLQNADVYAWREKRGMMGKITTSLYESVGGGCLECNQISPNPANAVDTITIEWIDPVNAVISLSGGTTHNVSRFNWYNGIGSNDADFIEDGFWQIYWQDIIYGGDSSGDNLYKSYYGLTRFNKVDTSLFIEDEFYDSDNIYYVSDPEYPLNRYLTSVYISVVGDPAPEQIMLVYNKRTKETYISDYFYTEEHGLLFITNLCQSITKGILRPDSSSESVLYGADDERCNDAQHSTDFTLKRKFATISRVRNAGAALSKNVAFKHRIN